MGKSSRLVALVLTMVMVLLSLGIAPGQAEEAADGIYDPYTATDVVAEYVDDITRNPYAIDITDEDFYGRYDALTDKWIKRGYFDYDRYPAMASVKEAAKNGDYDLAKIELRDYYRAKFNGYDWSYVTASLEATEGNYLMAQLLENNIFADPTCGLTPLGALTFSDTAGYAEVDITSTMQSILSNPGKQVSMFLMGMKKDGSKFELESKEASGGHPPVIELTAKGVTQSYIATDDAYISPSTNGTTQYGAIDSGRILVEESVSSIGLEIAVDAETKRGMVQFDLSEADASAQVTSAKLQLYGRNYGTAGEAQVAVVMSSDNAWNESNVSWYLGGADGTEVVEHSLFSYYGSPYMTFVPGTTFPQDNGFNAYSWRYGSTLLRFGDWVGSLTIPYLVNPVANDKYGWEAMRQWVGYLNQRGNQVRYDASLDASSRDSSIIYWVARLLQAGDYVTPDILSATAKYVWKECDDYNGTYDAAGNWQTFMLKAYVNMTALFNEFYENDEWIEWIQHVAEVNIGNAYNADGSLKEAAFSYGFNTVASAQLTFETKHQAAHSELQILNDRTLDMIEKGVRFAMELAMPGNLDPQYGDSAPYTRNYDSEFLKMAQRFADEEMLYIATNGKQGTEPEIKAMRYPDMGLYGMRTGWKKGSLYLFTDMDGGANAHTHKDDLSLIVHAYDNYLLTDQSFYSYSYSAGADLTVTEHHNTVEFDNTNQGKATTGTEKRFETNGGYDNFTLTTAAYDPAKQVSHTRNVLFIKPNYWIVNDYLVPAGDQEVSHNYKQHWHMLPGANPTLDTTNYTGRSNFGTEANIQVAQANGDDLVPSVVDGYFSTGTNSLFDAKYLRYEKDAAGPVLFDTVLYPERPTARAKVSTEKLTLENVKNNGVTAMSILIDDETSAVSVDASYYLVHDPAQKAEREFGFYETDGRSAYVERNGKTQALSRLLVQDAAYVSQNTDDAYLFKSNSQVSELSVEFNGYQVNMHSSQALALEDMTVYAENAGQIDQVFLNGEAVPFQKSGRYIYFGDSPIITDTTTEEPEEDTETDTVISGGGNHATGGSTGGGGGGGGSISGGSVSGGGAPSYVTPPAADTDTEPDGTQDAEDIPQAYQQQLAGHWGEAELTQAIKDGILQGVSQTDLALSDQTNRAQFTALLVRALGLEPTAYTGVFTDVAADAWYAGYVQTAYDNGLIAGVGEGCFDPDGILSREQMAKLLVAACEKMQEKEIQADGTLDFADEDAISEWARDYVAKAKAMGLLLGDTENRFLPADGVTRAQAAVAVQRLRNLQ